MRVNIHVMSLWLKMWVGSVDCGFLYGLVGWLGKRFDWLVSWLVGWLCGYVDWLVCRGKGGL